MPISGEDLEAYLKLRRHSEPVSIRGFQRIMGYKSPGQAERVLRRLERTGLAVKTPSGYVARRELPPELSSYIIVKGIVLPRALVYAVFATTTVATYTFIAKPPWYFAVLLLALIAPYWVELYRSITMVRKLRSQANQLN